MPIDTKTIVINSLLSHGPIIAILLASLLLGAL
jgi:hypothetical protein